MMPMWSLLATAATDAANASSREVPIYVAVIGAAGAVLGGYLASRSGRKQNTAEHGLTAQKLDANGRKIDALAGDVSDVKTAILAHLQHHDDLDPMSRADIERLINQSQEAHDEEPVEEHHQS